MGTKRTKTLNRSNRQQNMNKQSTIMRISLRLFNKLPNELNKEEKEKVIDIYNDYY